MSLRPLHREGNIGALYKSITQVVKKICSHAIWIGRECVGKDGICFWEGDGLAVQRLPVKQVMLFTSASLNHKQMFYLRSQNVVYSSLLRFPLSPSAPARLRSVCSAHLTASSIQGGNKHTPDRKLCPVM